MSPEGDNATEVVPASLSMPLLKVMKIIRKHFMLNTPISVSVAECIVVTLDLPVRTAVFVTDNQPSSYHTL